ncbi:MAG: hypothetical protein K6F68_03790 [Clostridiales bacterium]|nr:hypothetical protein [Clostridiales bacterium]
MKRSLKDTLSNKDAKRTESAGAEALPGDISALADRYKGMNESELMTNLMKETRRRKADGSFDMDSIQKGVNAILPMLDAGQRKRLFEIIGKMEKE